MRCTTLIIRQVLGNPQRLTAWAATSCAAPHPREGAVQYKYKPEGQFKNVRCVYTVHNIAFQGRFWPESMEGLAVPEPALQHFQFTDGFSKVYDEQHPKDDDGMESDIVGKHNKVNWMRAGFLASDRNVTVSPNYAREVASGPDRGVELDDVIRQTGIEGIVNGVALLPSFAHRKFMSFARLFLHVLCVCRRGAASCTCRWQIKLPSTCEMHQWREIARRACRHGRVGVEPRDRQVH
jgi:Starch synthase catalytic domain